MSSESEEITQSINKDNEEIGEGIPEKTSNTESPCRANASNGETTEIKMQTRDIAETEARIGDYKNIRATSSNAKHCEQRLQQQQSSHPIRREENPFSFKHFLNRDTAPSNVASSSFVISSSPSTTVPDSMVNNSESGNVPVTSSTPMVMQSKISTGARPKVPQSSSSTLIGNNSTTTNRHVSTSIAVSSSTESSKMKRSPRFSSFDSQASLAEYAANGYCPPSTTSSSNPHPSLNFRISQNNDDELVDNIANSEPPDNIYQAADDRQQYTPRRSYSNYDIDGQPCVRGRAPETNRSVRVCPKQQTSSYHSQHCSTSNPGNSGQRLPNTEYAAAAALPDFVQDHWMDAWYCNEMNLDSPPNTPNSPIDFVEDITGGAAIAPSSGNVASSTTDTKCQTLPDFLSDGPIIHSAQRLADVAADLPSNVHWSDLDSPEDDSPNLELTRLRLENARLYIELNETRQALKFQTRRSNELQRSLEQTRKKESDSVQAKPPEANQSVDSSSASAKRVEVAESQVTKLTQQVKQLTAQVNALRRENETLRENDGAVGGSHSSDLPSGGGAPRNRPSRSNQLARELRRAASVAESNLRQLLTGVENLRQLAADVETTDYDETYGSTYPPMSDDFIDSCDDYDDYTGGPAL